MIPDKNDVAASPAAADSAATAPGMTSVSWRLIAKEAVFPLIVSRLALVLVGWLAMSMLTHTVKPGTWEIGGGGKMTQVNGHVSTFYHPFVNMWSRWDGGWYQSIAQSGYKFTAGRPSNVAFFPMYPMLMRAVCAILHSHTAATWMLAGIIVSNAALVAALAYLFLLARLEFDEATARRAVLYLLIFPMTLFLSAVYSESVFLAFTIGSFYHARKRQWWIAGVLGAAATLSRPTGMMIGVALVTEYGLQCGFNWRKVRLDLLALALVPLALAAFLTYLHYAEGAASAMVQAQGSWGLRLQPQWRTLAPFFQKGLDLRGTFIDLGFTLAFTALVVAVMLRMRASYATYSAAYLFFITMWGSLESVPRYGLGLFPAIMLLAVVGRNRTFDRIYVPFSAALAALFMAVFAVWGWVA